MSRHMIQIHKLAFAVAGSVLLALNAAAQTCGLNTEFLQPDVEGQRTLQRRVLVSPEAVVFSERLHVNTDGHVRSYNANDLLGDRCGRLAANADPYASGCAMNTVCNGVNVLKKKSDGTVDKIDYSRCPELREAFAAIRDANPKWLPADGSRIEFYAVETKGRSGDSKHVPCEGENGFLVSMASTASGVSAGVACEQKKFLDALVPSIVAPMCWTKAYRARNPKICKNLLPEQAALDLQPGDLVAVAASDGEVKFGVIGDTGPNRKLGEASVGMHMQLRGKPEPRTRKETNALGGASVYDVVIFRKSAVGGAITPEATGAMIAAAKAKFEAWGGGAGAARSRLRLCGAAARSH
jgi:hypothetical protein